MSYKQKPLPWGAYRLSSEGKWELVTSFKYQGQAEHYARIVRNSCTGLVTQVAYSTEKEMSDVAN